MTESETRYRVGCQSWQYDDWVTKIGGPTVFYPRGTKSADMLAIYAEVFDTIEVDSTAYGPPAASTLTGWADATPDNFVFSLKTPRAVTHEMSLAPASYTLFDEFVEIASVLADRLAMILIQLPAVFEPTKENGANLRAFVARLPKHIRFAVEFRHPSWFVDWTFDELNEHHVALALVAGKWIPEETMFDAFEKTTTPFAYVRMMGVRDLPRFDRVYRDRSNEIADWAERIGRLAARDVFAYVDNYFEGHGPTTANKLKRSLNVEITDPATLESQATLF